MLMALGVACASALLAASADDREEHAFTLDPGGKFSLDNVNGDITIRASEGNRVQVVAVKRVKAMDQEKAKEALSKLKVAIESSPSEIVVKTIYPSAKEGLMSLGSFMSVEYTVTVPNGTKLQLSGVNGTITIAVPAAEVSCETTNGSIRAEGAKLLSATTVNGRIRFDAENIHEVSSTNGSVEGTLRALKPSGGKIETVNGAVTMSLPTAAAVRIEAENVNGSIHNEMAGLSVQKHSLSGDLNGGGSTLSIETVNGGVEIKAAL
jgi:DUF4097 and DUF4098 domain-containing protein YvlB